MTGRGDRSMLRLLLSVMPGQKRVFALDVPGIHALVSRKTWMAGSSPAMTKQSCILKFRRTLFRKSLDAFLDLGAAHALAMAEVGGFLVELATGEFVDGALHAAHRNRRVAGQDVGEPVDFLVERIPPAPWR